MKPSTKNIVRSLFHQLTVGCGVPSCENVECRSCSNFKYKFSTANDAAAMALKLAPDYLNHLCKLLQPTFLYDNLYSNDFTVFIKKLINKEKFDKKEAKKLINRTFSSIENLMYVFTTGEGLLTENNLFIDEKFISEAAEAIYEREDIFGEFRDQFQDLVEIFFTDFQPSPQHLRALIVLPVFKIYFEEEIGVPCRFTSHYFIVISQLKDPYEFYFSKLAKFPLIIKIILQILQTYMSFYMLTYQVINPFEDPNISVINDYLDNVREIMDGKIVKSDDLYNDLFSTVIVEAFRGIRPEIPIFKFYLAALNPSSKYTIVNFFTNYYKYSEGIIIFEEEEDSKTTLIKSDDHMLLINVHRNTIVEDAMRQIEGVERCSLKNNFQVSFVGEIANDEGGVSREFFYLSTVEAFSPKNKLCILINNRISWFDITSAAPESSFCFLGKLIGLAIYNCITVPIHFPRVLYKKLLELPLTLEDLNDIDPEKYKSFMTLKEMKEKGTDISKSELTFTASYEAEGSVVTKNLVYKGSEIHVNNDNLEDYINAYVKWELVTSVDRMFTPFMHGLYDVCDQDVFRLLLPEEFEIFVSGENVFDWDALKEATEYADGYEKDSETIVLFWECFEELDEEMKIKFLFFLTGTDKAPVGGLINTHIVIQKCFNLDQLPVAHTCFNILSLPDYCDKEKINNSLEIILQHTEGFGLI